MPGKVVPNMVINSQHHRGVVIYKVKNGKEDDLPDFCKNNVKDFLKSAAMQSKRADFWTVKVGGDVLLMCALDKYDSNWNGVSHIEDFLEASGVVIMEQAEWLYQDPVPVPDADPDSEPAGS